MTASTDTARSDAADGGAAAVDQAGRWRLRHVGRRGALALVVAAVGNVLLFLVASAMGVFADGVINPGTGQPFTPVEVLLSSSIGVVGATVVYALFDRFLTNTDRWFRVVVGVVLVVSVVMPLTIPGAPTAVIATLLAMHVVVAGASIWAFTIAG